VNVYIVVSHIVLFQNIVFMKIKD